MTTVRQWTGLEAKALRMATRMSLRRFADHLGVTTAAVSNWEQRGELAKLRYETQQMLDTELARSTDDVRIRFAQELGADHDQATGGSTDASAGPSPSQHEDHDRASCEPESLGTRSSERTRTLLETINRRHGTSLAYLPPVDLPTLIADFVASSWRAFVLAGPPGSGKTLLTQHLAALSDTVDVQLHHATERHTNDTALAQEILRYASCDALPDPLLTLEQYGAHLTRPLIVVIDGLRGTEQITAVCRSIDGLLRQVLTTDLRFMLVFRTPPGVELSPHPVLAASVYRAAEGGLDPAQPRPAEPGNDVSLRLSRWQPAQAAHVWDNSRAETDLRFHELPKRVQYLARLPLYMHLIRLAGGREPFQAANAYRLVDFCVRAIIRTTGGDIDTVVTQLGILAQKTLPDVVVPRPVPTDAACDPSVDVDRLACPDSPLVWGGGSEAPRFHHDIVGEFFLAARLVTLLSSQGRAAATINALDDLVEQATTSAAARGVVELLIQGLDTTDPDLLAEIAVSPAIRITSTLPALLDLAGPDAAFATADILLACARRATSDNGAALARALLRHPRLQDALTTGYTSWLAQVLQRFGATIWPDLADHIERHLSAQAARDVFATANLGSPNEAIFFARHAHLFFGDDPSLVEPLRQLRHHPDWRVRAALADSVRCRPPSTAAGVDAIVDELAHDRDYKVRAAVAEAVGRSAAPWARRQTPALLVDANWHVRERLLRGLLAGQDLLPGDVVDAANADPDWRDAPIQVRSALQRLLLLDGRPPADGPAHRRALFGLLREHRTGTRRLPAHLISSITQQAAASGDWLLEREAEAVASPGNTTGGQDSGYRAAESRTRASDTWPADVHNARGAYRRLRDRRHVQIALDLHDLDRAVAVAEAAAAASVAFVEVGDPLIKSKGTAAIGHIKRRVPGVAVVAEMMSADWGRDQVVLAAEAGADVVMLIGPASIASVTAAVDVGARLGVPILLDVPTGRLLREWVHDMERAGVDGFGITTNIDLGVANTNPLTQARLLRSWTRLPVAVSGGFSTTDRTSLRSPGWDILVVGRAVADALSPAAAIRQLVELIQPHDPRRPTG